MSIYISIIDSIRVYFTDTHTHSLLLEPPPPLVLACSYNPLECRQYITVALARLFNTSTPLNEYPLFYDGAIPVVKDIHLSLEDAIGKDHLHHVLNA